MKNYNKLNKVIGASDIENINLIVEETYLSSGGYIKLPKEIIEGLNLSIGDSINFIVENTEIPRFTMLSGEDETITDDIISIPEILLLDANMTIESNIAVTCDDGKIIISETNEDIGVGYYVME